MSVLESPANNCCGGVGSIVAGAVAGITVTSGILFCCEGDGSSETFRGVATGLSRDTSALASVMLSSSLLVMYKAINS